MNGEMRMDDVLEMQRAFESLFASRVKFATITDARRAGSMPSSALRRAITDWNVRHEAETRAYNVAGVAIFESAITRAVLRAIHWVAPHPAPYLVVASMDEALAFVLRALEEDQVPIPSSVDVRSIRDASG